jgi:hypothetical protein
MYYLLLITFLSVLSLIILKTLLKPSLTPQIQENNISEFCPNCHNNGWWDQSNCQRCINCGWSVGKDGHGQCIPGTVDGPIININTVDWYHGGHLIWSSGDSNRNNILVGSDKMPLDLTRNFQRSDNGYGNKRYGRPFGHGWDPIYQHQRV